MGATYAGVLGPMAASFVLFREVKNGGAPESALLIGAIALIVFAMIGYLVGRIAQQTIEDSVHFKYHAALAAAQEQRAAGEGNRDTKTT